MAKIIGMSEAAAIALHAMVYIAQGTRAGVNPSVKEIASKIDASEAHLAKVVQRLAKAGLVTTSRGPKGGVSLARSADDITFLDVFEAIEGRIATDGCLFGCEKCPFGRCIFDGLLERLTDEAREKFAGTKLSDHV